MSKLEHIEMQGILGTLFRRPNGMNGGLVVGWPSSLNGSNFLRIKKFATFFSQFKFPKITGISSLDFQTWVFSLQINQNVFSE